MLLAEVNLSSEEAVTRLAKWERGVADSYEEWLAIFEGYVECNCGHGCADWLSANVHKTLLILKILSKKNATTSLDRVAKMEKQEVIDIYCKLMMRNIKTQRRVK